MTLKATEIEVTFSCKKWSDVKLLVKTKLHMSVILCQLVVKTIN